MRTRAALVLAGLLAPLPAAARMSEGQVSVAFVDPERYTDAGNHAGAGPPLRVTLAEIRRLFTELGARALQPGESLAVTVLDIDLAGFDRPGANPPYGLRVVTDAAPPRLRLRYVLEDRGRTVLAAEETVSDINFLTRYARALSGGSFTYERELIRDWLQTRIARRLPPRG